MARINRSIPSTRTQVSAEEKLIYCKGTVRSGRFAGFRCGNAKPCIDHEIRPLALNMQAMGADEYPYGFYEHMARERLQPTRVRIRRESVLW